MQGDLEVLLERGRAPKTVEAIKYALGQWELLMRDLDDPKANIDNNRAEQAIRPTKLGMKNWLFVGHPEAGKRSAIIYTLAQNCKKSGYRPAGIPHRCPAKATDMRFSSRGGTCIAAKALETKSSFFVRGCVGR